MRAKARLCRRRWAVRGRAFADFTLSFALATLGHLLFSGFRLGCWVVLGIWRGFARLGHRRTDYGTSTRSLLSQQAEVLFAPLEDGATAGQGIDTLRGERNGFIPISEKPNVRFSDVAGLKEAKQEVFLRMILPLLYPERAREYGIREGGGILLYGPPGTGKTMLARAVATEVDAPFYSILPSDVMSGTVGQAEKNVKRLFQTLRREKRAVLFIDEVEGLIASRRSNNSTIMKRVIPQFLAEVDGLAGKPNGHVLLVIGATNEPSMVDAAMMRGGRFDAKVYVGPPDKEARKQMLAANLAGRPVADDTDLDRIAARTEGMTGADLRTLVDKAADSAFLSSITSPAESRQITMRDLESAYEHLQDELIPAG